MIERNLGNVERALRLVFGLVLLGWASTREGMNAADWFVVLVAVALVLNGIFSRCYLWYLLDIDTRRPRGTSGGSHPDSTCP